MESDETGQNGTNSGLPPEGNDRRTQLAPKQVIALAALISGKTVTEAAVLANVSRSTLNRWISNHSAFKSALHEERSALREAAVTQIFAKMPEMLSKLFDTSINDESAELRIMAARVIVSLANVHYAPPKDGKNGDQPSIAELLELAGSPEGSPA